MTPPLRRGTARRLGLRLPVRNWLADATRQNMSAFDSVMLSDEDTRDLCRQITKGMPSVKDSMWKAVW